MQLKQTAYEQIAVGKLVELFGVLKRKTEKKTNLSKEHFGKIAGIVQHIHRNYEKDETLEAYAQMCALSKFHFLRKFEAITGMTPIAYRNRIRLSHAKEKLEDLSLSVSEIAFSCGYSSAAYFCDAFKREYGLSPNTYRAAKQEGDPR